MRSKCLPVVEWLARLFRHADALKGEAELVFDLPNEPGRRPRREGHREPGPSATVSANGHAAVADDYE